METIEYQEDRQTGGADKQSVLYLLFDTETDGVRKPDGKWTNKQAIIEISWIIFDVDFNIVKRCDYKISDVAVEIAEDNPCTNLTIDDVRRIGVPWIGVLEEFVDDIDIVKRVIAHNFEFDQSVVLHSMTMKGLDLTKRSLYFKLLRAFRTKSFCTKEKTVQWCKIASRFGYKWPSMAELYAKLFGAEINQKHTSKDDCDDLLVICKECVKRGIIKF